MTWHKGAPPRIGWWPASLEYDDGVYRWWNGARWSMPCVKGMDLDEIARYAATPVRLDAINENMKWREWDSIIDGVIP